jgi:hypothetical protein
METAQAWFGHDLEFDSDQSNCQKLHLMTSAKLSSGGIRMP